MTALQLSVWTAGAALTGAVAFGAVRDDLAPVDRASIAYLAVLAAITIGILVWKRRPESRTGLLLTAYPFAWLLADFNNVFPTSALAVTVGFTAAPMGLVLFAQLVLSYPSGRLDTRLERAFLAIAYAVASAIALLFLLFYSPRAPSHPQVWDCPVCAEPLTHVLWYDVSDLVDRLFLVSIALAAVFVGLLLRKLARASPRGRSVVLPLAVAALFVAVQFIAQVVVVGEPINSWRDGGYFVVLTSTVLVVPGALAAGLLLGRTSRAAVADLVVELERAPPGSVRDALARALGDPSLELALWLPERGSYVDRAGRQVQLPSDGLRAVTVLGPADEPVAAVVHDPALLERTALLHAAGAAARLALENERLQAELRAQLVELRASRARIVTAGDEERRRLERDLHDGAQQRLISVGLALQLAKAALGPTANGAAELLLEAEAELRAAFDELRELAGGIHPAVLTDQGLSAALRTLADRSPLPVTILGLPDERLPTPVEAAAYFLVSEAVANAAKYARASRVRVSVTHRDERVVVEVDDDGIGGADPSRGSGLRGLADRVRALDGELETVSAPGRGTRLRAVIPCA